MVSPRRTPRRRTRATVAQSIPEDGTLSPGWTTGSADLFKMPASSPVQTARVTRRSSMYPKCNQKRPGQPSVGEPVPKSRRGSVYKKASPAKRAKVPSPKRKPTNTQIKKPVETKLTKLKQKSIKAEEMPAAPSLLAKATPSLAKRSARVTGRSPSPKKSTKAASPKKRATPKNNAKSVSPKKSAKRASPKKDASPKKNAKTASPKKVASPKKIAKTASPKKVTSPKEIAKPASPKKVASPKKIAKPASPKKVASPKKNAKSVSPKKSAKTASPKKNTRIASRNTNPATLNNEANLISPSQAAKSESPKKNASSKKSVSRSLRKTAKLISPLNQSTPKSVGAKKVKKSVTVAFSDSMKFTPNEQRSSKVLRQRSQKPQTPYAAEVPSTSESAKKSAKKPMSSKKKAVKESTSPSLSFSTKDMNADSSVVFKTPKRLISTTGASTIKSVKSVTIASPMITPRIMAAPKALVSELEAVDTSQDYLSPLASIQSTKKSAMKTPRSRKRVAQTPLPSSPKSKLLIQSNGQSPSGKGPEVKGDIYVEEKENEMKLDESMSVVATERQESKAWSWCAIL